MEVIRIITLEASATHFGYYYYRVCKCTPPNNFKIIAKNALLLYASWFSITGKVLISLESQIKGGCKCMPQEHFCRPIFGVNCSHVFNSDDGISEGVQSLNWPLGDGRRSTTYRLYRQASCSFSHACQNFSDQRSNRSDPEPSTLLREQRAPGTESSGKIELREHRTPGTSVSGNIGLREQKAPGR